VCLRRIQGEDLVGRSIKPKGALAEKQNAGTKTPDFPEVVTDEYQRGARGGAALQRLLTLLREAGVTREERLVEDEQIGFDGEEQRETESRAHSRRVGADRLIEELAEVSERPDFVDVLCRIPEGKTKRGRETIDVLSAGQSGIESRPVAAQKRATLGRRN
jgi:hypothetical protein